MGGQGGRDETGRKRAEGGEEEEEDAGEDGVLRWQVPFVMGRICSRLNRDPRTVLDELAQAVRLAQVTCLLSYTLRVL